MDNNNNSLSPTVKILSTSEEVYRMFFSTNGAPSPTSASCSSNNNNSQASNPAQAHNSNNSQSHKQQQLPVIQPTIRISPSAVSNSMPLPFDIKHRKRTSREQLQVLEKSFSENPRPTSEQRKELAMLLDMTPRGVQIWFQNRRAKLKTKTRDEEHFNSLRRSKELGLSPNPTLGLGMCNSATQQQSSSNVNNGPSLSYANQLQHQHHHSQQQQQQQQAPFIGRISSILTPQLSPLIPPFYATSGTIGGPGSGQQQQHCSKYSVHPHPHPYPSPTTANLMYQAQQGHPVPPWQQRTQKKPNSQPMPAPANTPVVLHRDVMHDIEEAIMNSNFDFFKKENTRNHNPQCSGAGAGDSSSSLIGGGVNNGSQMMDQFSNAPGLASAHHTIYYDPFPSSNTLALPLPAKQRTCIDPTLSMFCKGGTTGVSGKGNGVSNGSSGAVVNAEELLSEYINYANS